MFQYYVFLRYFCNSNLENLKETFWKVISETMKQEVTVEELSVGWLNGNDEYKLNTYQ